MGSRHSYLTPFPPNYISITIRPKNELWICQGPPKLIDFTRALINNIWPQFDHKERHCNAPEKIRGTCNGHPHPILRNTVFQIPTEPYAFSPSHQSTEVAESAYYFVMMLVAYIYSMDYKMISAGHFIQGTEASTCLFRCAMDCQQMNDLTNPIADCNSERCTKRKMLTSKRLRALKFNPSKRMLAVGLEGWNRLYCINFTDKLVSELADYLQRIWPQRISFHKIRNSPYSERLNDKRGCKVTSKLENEFSFLVEIEGHPWDSYKEHSDLTPFLMLSLIQVLKNAGYDFECRANIRGLLDTLFFVRPDVLTTPHDDVVRICFSMCHQNTFRIYGGTPSFCNWINQLLGQLWVSGVASEKQISFAKPNPSPEVYQQGGNADHFTEIKLNGTPFCIPEWNKDNFLAAQYMIGRLIGVLSLIGWHLTTFLNAYSSPYDKGLLIFEKISNEGQEPIDLEVVEFRMQTDMEDRPEKPKLYDLLRPVCFTSYEIDHLCVLGGSQKFLQNFDNSLLQLFDTSSISRSVLSCKRQQKHPSNGNIASAKLVDKDALISNKWITSRMPYQPNLLYKTTLGAEQSFLCLVSPHHEHLALAEIFAFDPDNVLEYATNCQIWNTNSCWLQRIFHKARNRANKFFYLSQIPLAVLCWINEFISSATQCETEQPSHQEGANDGTEIVQVASSSEPRRRSLLTKSSEGALVACMDCASTVRNGPPVWIYLIKEGKQSVILESRHMYLSR